MRPSRGTVQSTIEIMTGGSAVVDRGTRRFAAPGRLRRTPVGLGARFPLTDPLTMSTMWPAASIDGYLLSPAAPALAPALAGAGLAGRSAKMLRAVRGLERRLSGPEQPGGAFGIAVAVFDGRTIAIGQVEIDDTYELTSAAAYEVARRLCGGAGQPGVRSAAAVLGDPYEVAATLGVRLRVS
jgi:hypothetical protein